MIELLTLEFGNIRSFVDGQVVSLEGRDKLIQIDGKNENTGGSSGAGKSTVLLALDYLLGIGSIPSTVLQSRLTKDGIWVKGSFLIDGHPVFIERSKKNGLVIKTPTETVSGNSDLAEEKLVELIGLPNKVFKKMIHKKQKEGGFFLNQTPKEMYEFLISVLGLERYVSDIDKISIKTTENIKKAEQISRDIDLSQSSLIDMERILSEKKQPTVSVSDEQIKLLNHGALAVRANIAALKLEVKQMIEEVPKPQELVADTSEINAQIAAIVPSRVALNDKLKVVEEKKTAIEKALNAIPFAISAAKKAGEEVARIRAEKEHMEKSQCPTCMQAWVGDTVQEKIAKAEVNIKYFINEALEQKKVIDKKPSLEEDLGRLLSIKKTINEDLAKLQEQRSALDSEKYAKMEEVGKQNAILKEEYNDKCLLIESKVRNTIDKLHEDLKKIEIELSSKESERNSYLSSLSQYEKEVSSLNTVIAKKKHEIETAKANLEALKKQIAIADETKRLIKAYVLQTFQETLDSIGDQATSIIAAIPNMGTSTIYFEGCKETKAGAIKDEITAIINMDGNHDVPIKSLSGGERTAIDLAVDLAVIDVIETKVGKGANFFFMDEPFDGLDAVCKENCLEILKQLDTNKKIIMVDHSSELKEMVSDVIMVVKKGETSHIAS